MRAPNALSGPLCLGSHTVGALHTSVGAWERGVVVRLVIDRSALARALGQPYADEGDLRRARLAFRHAVAGDWAVQVWSWAVCQVTPDAIEADGARVHRLWMHRGAAN